LVFAKLVAAISSQLSAPQKMAQIEINKRVGNGYIILLAMRESSIVDNKSITSDILKAL